MKKFVVFVSVLSLGCLLSFGQDKQETVGGLSVKQDKHLAKQLRKQEKMNLRQTRKSMAGTHLNRKINKTTAKSYSTSTENNVSTDARKFN